MSMPKTDLLELCLRNSALRLQVIAHTYNAAYGDIEKRYVAHVKKHYVIKDTLCATLLALINQGD